MQERKNTQMKNKNILDLSEQYNNYIYPKPTENLQEEWIKKNPRIKFTAKY